MVRRNHAGFTLAEVTIILLILVTLGAVLLPTIERFVDLARNVRVNEDLIVLASAVSLFLYDTQLPCFLRDGGYATAAIAGNPPSLFDNNRVDALFSDGDIPPLDIVGPPMGIDWWGWNGFGPVNADTIDNHLAAGDPYGNHPITGYVNDPNDWYMRPNTTHGPGFRGAYITAPVQPDPWGNRYSINVAFLYTDGTPTADLFGLGATVEQFLSKDVFVLSAGPDGVINTSFYLDGVVAQRDDALALISGHGRGTDKLP